MKRETAKFNETYADPDDVARIRRLAANSQQPIGEEYISGSLKLTPSQGSRLSKVVGAVTYYRTKPGTGGGFEVAVGNVEWWDEVGSPEMALA